MLCLLHSYILRHHAAENPTTWLCAMFHAGRRAGLWTVIPCQLIVMIGLDIVYCVTAGKSMQYLYHHTCPGWREGTCAPFGLSAWIVIFAVIQMILSMVSPMHAVVERYGLPPSWGPSVVVAMSRHLHRACSPSSTGYAVVLVVVHAAL